MNWPELLPSPIACIWGHAWISTCTNKSQSPLASGCNTSHSASQQLPPAHCQTWRPLDQASELEMHTMLNTHHPSSRREKSSSRFYWSHCLTQLWGQLWKSWTSLSKLSCDETLGNMHDAQTDRTSVTRQTHSATIWTGLNLYEFYFLVIWLSLLQQKKCLH